MKYTKELRKIVADYSRIRKSLESLEEQTKQLTLQKNQVELELAQIREDETLLIDKIKTETGQAPDFYKILQELNEEANIGA
jgi:predicted  nucleic acid-binding Zn-ribbon protein